MFLSSLFIALTASAPLLVSAAPSRLTRRAAASDVLVFKFADVLEQLESAFYCQALKKFQSSDFTAAGFSSSLIPIEQFKTIQVDEATHSTVLQAALKSFGETPITSCKFNFAGALTDVATMAATARVVENVGVSAYLGGATLITDPVLLDAAGSILTVEARHQTILNILSGTGTAIPAAFDIPLAPNEILAIAGPFFDGPCDLGIAANPTLAITNTGTVAPGTKLTFSSSAINGSTDNLFCQMMLGGQPNSIALPFNNCVVPSGINGPVAIFITSDGQPLVNNIRDRASTQLVAGPTMAFIDTQPQTIGSLVRGTGSAVASTSTTTISPAEASAIIASATPVALSTPSLANSVISTNGGPNKFTGKSPDGNLIVNGWSST
ncbi:uncharacterized protein LACBIDRAFT_330070 [Laccaria bicolor S238N-H82]|uniref:Predicted protein n=1 Tax=Laccaria bicolor (strain S238N-H82 / ATCC MYA-4686) TaxID=486041 RepID=B0DK63_LACBS|nr:uncharacterized protein LACBIDRAFT_330070 [Laccaria bicolor S238N-H82]EDR05013.1 predicted protein [Laccaria bicolor S238N-H82]|eukprot:XP_001884403.1 predicted protein [Laccaria bicolor S238N-H82]